MPLARRLALAIIGFPFLFAALVIVQGLLQPEYSHVSMPISALAAFPYGRIQVANFLVAGTFLTLFAVAQHRGVRPTPRGVLGPAFQFVGGLGVVGAGLFSWRMVDGVPTRTPSHVVAAATAFGFTGLGIIVISRRLAEDPDWSLLASYTRATGLAVLAVFVIFTFLAADGAPLQPWVGLVQRIMCVLWFTWLVLMALRFRRLSKVPFVSSRGMNSVNQGSCQRARLLRIRRRFGVSQRLVGSCSRRAPALEPEDHSRLLVR